MLNIGLRLFRCLFLIGDIAPIPECQSHLSPLIPHIIKASQARSFSQHVIFLETLCKIVPPLAKGIGKKPFKEFLAAFFEPIFYSIVSIVLTNISRFSSFQWPWTMFHLLLLFWKCAGFRKSSNRCIWKNVPAATGSDVWSKYIEISHRTVWSKVYCFPY